VSLVTGQSDRLTTTTADDQRGSLCRFVNRARDASEGQFSPFISILWPRAEMVWRLQADHCPSCPNKGSLLIRSVNTAAAASRAITRSSGCRTCCKRSTAACRTEFEVRERGCCELMHRQHRRYTFDIAGQSRLASPRSHLVAVGLRLEVDGIDAVALFADDVVVCRCVGQRRVGRQILVHLRQRPV